MDNVGRAIYRKLGTDPKLPFDKLPLALFILKISENAPPTDTAQNAECEERSMYAGSPTEFARSRPVIECAQCGAQLFAPEWSKYVDQGRVRHLWNCEACGYSFETTVCFPALAK